MNLHSVGKILALAAILMCSAAPLRASIIAGSASFEAWGFTAGAPTDPVFGSVFYSFDNAANFFNTPDGGTANGAPVHVSISSLGLPGSWVPVLTYVKSGILGGLPVSDVLAIGDVLNGTLVVAGTSDWRVAFNNASTAPTFREFTYSTAGAPTLYVSTTGVVPEPATLALFALGVVAFRLSRRRP
jgi:hypothetical protein